MEDYKELALAYQDAERIYSDYSEDDTAEFRKMDHAVELLLQNEAQSYNVSKGKQSFKQKGWKGGYDVITHPSVVLTISFPSSTEKPVATLANGVNEYERVDVGNQTLANGSQQDYDTHLQFSQSLGGFTVPDFDCDGGGLLGL